MDDSNYYRQDDLDLKKIQGKIRIWLGNGIMDGGTIILLCRYEDKLFQIVSKQSFIDETGEYLRLNETRIALGSEEEKIMLKLIRESINAADSLWFLPTFMKIFLWSKRKRAYWVYIFKREVLNFVNSEQYLQCANKEAK